MGLSAFAQATIPEPTEYTPAIYNCYQNNTWIVEVCNSESNWQIAAKCGPDQKYVKKTENGYCI